MIRRPPRSTLFPYHDALPISARSAWPPVSAPRPRPAATPRRRRSEEYTSELQSLRHLVCRLLLEKKKKNYRKMSEMRDACKQNAKTQTHDANEADHQHNNRDQ